MFCAWHSRRIPRSRTTLAQHSTTGIMISSITKEQRWMPAMFEISSVEGEIGNHESVALVGPRDCLSDQKPPRVAAVAIGEAKSVREIGEAVEVHMRQITGAFNTIMDVLPPQPPIKPRDAAGIMKLDEMGGHVACGPDREHRSG